MLLTLLNQALLLLCHLDDDLRSGYHFNMYGSARLRLTSTLLGTFVSQGTPVRGPLAVIFNRSLSMISVALRLDVQALPCGSLLLWPSALY